MLTAPVLLALYYQITLKHDRLHLDHTSLPTRHSVTCFFFALLLTGSIPASQTKCSAEWSTGVNPQALLHLGWRGPAGWIKSYTRRQPHGQDASTYLVKTELSPECDYFLFCHRKPTSQWAGMLQRRGKHGVVHCILGSGIKEALRRKEEMNRLDLYEHKERSGELNEPLQMTFPDMFSWLVCGVSAYTLGQFRNCKSLETHKWMGAGFSESTQLLFQHCIAFCHYRLLSSVRLTHFHFMLLSLLFMDDR